MAPKHLLEAARASVLAAHSAAGLATTAGQRTAARLLRSAEAMARAAVAALAELQPAREGQGVRKPLAEERPPAVTPSVDGQEVAMQQSQPSTKHDETYRPHQGKHYAHALNESVFECYWEVQTHQT